MLFRRRDKEGLPLRKLNTPSIFSYSKVFQKFANKKQLKTTQKIKNIYSLFHADNLNRCGKFIREAF